MFNQQNIKVGSCNVVENINQNVMRSIKDKGKLVMDEGGPSQNDLTPTIEPRKTSKEIKLEYKKRKKVYELKLKFQITWVAKLPWIKSILTKNELVTHVYCKNCKNVISKEKKIFLVLFLFANMIVGRKLFTSHLIF